MLCEKCKAKNAVVHYKQVINGEVTEYNLCQECAKDIEKPISFDNFFKGFMDIGYGEALSGMSGVKSIPIHKCPVCGYTLEDLQSTGKLGCKECYSAFRDRLNPLLKNIHGSNRHISLDRENSALNEDKNETGANRELLELKAELLKAIESEEYEKAAEIRDKIRGIERGEA